MSIEFSKGFVSTKIGSIEIPSEVKVIGAKAFSQCKSFDGIFDEHGILVGLKEREVANVQEERQEEEGHLGCHLCDAFWDEIDSKK